METGDKEPVLHHDEVKIINIEPEDTEIFTHQVGGHQVGVGVLKHKKGFVMKPKQEDSRGIRELEFYRKVSQTEVGCSGEVRRKLKLLIPDFLGVSRVVVPDKNEGREYLMLQDVVDGFKKPCVLDIKIGTITWDPIAPPSKIYNEMNKYIGTRKSLGISIAGMCYFDIDTNEFVRKDRHFGRDLNHDSLYDSLKVFLNYKTSKKTKIIIKKILQKLNQIKHFFDEQQEFAFYSSSILISYDAEFLDDSVTSYVSDKNCGDDEYVVESDHWVRAFMIDFAHVFPLSDGTSRDENYLFGLKSVIKLFRALYDDQVHFVNKSSSDNDISVTSLEVIPNTCDS